MGRKIIPNPGDLGSLAEHLEKEHGAKGWYGYGFRDMQRVHKNEFHFRSGEAVDEDMKGITPHSHKGKAASSSAEISAKAVVKKALRTNLPRSKRRQ